MKKILWIDDSPDQVADIAETLRDEGLTVELVSSASEGASMLAAAPDDFLAVIVDLLILGESFSAPGDQGPELIETHHGLSAGMAFGRWVKRRWPMLNVIGVSVKRDRHDPQVRWFKETADGYFDKQSLYISPRALSLLLHILADEAEPPMSLQTYVLHGRDETAKNDLVQYLKNMLRIPEPIVLHEQPGRGRAFLEKPREETLDFLLVFLLLTAGDHCAGTVTEKDAGRATRESLFFETGCLYGRCPPGKGKVLVLHDGEPGLPADIPGLVFIDIRNGIKAAAEKIGREVFPYLPLLRRRK